MVKVRRPIVASGWADVTKGRVEFDQPAQVKAAITSWTRYTKAWNGRVTVTIAPEVETRRAQANRFYWAVVLKMLAEESGHTVDDLHELMKAEHNSVMVEWTDPRTGEVSERRIPRSTTTLTVEEFSEYLNRVMLMGAEFFGIVFPDARAA